MSGVVRDLYRYHHWPERKDYWARSIKTDAFQGSPRPTDDDLHGIFGSTGEYVGYDNRVNYKNREMIRYHHWPNRRNWQNRYAIKKESPTPARPSQSVTPRKVPPLLLTEKPKSDYGRRQPEQEPNHEHSEYDFMRANNLTTTTAPFGNMYTPQLVYKIVGGVKVPVIQSLHSNEYPPGSYGPRVPPIQKITESPTKSDPKVLEDSVKAHYNAQKPEEVLYGEKYYNRLMRLDNFSSNVQGNPIYTKKRPDSKSFSRFKSLPPIRQNFHRNHESTVFEREPWIRSGGSPPLAEDTEYNHQYHDGRPFSDRPVNGYHSENNFKLNFQSEQHFNQPDKANSEIVMDPKIDRMRKDLLEKYLPPRNYEGKTMPTDGITLDDGDIRILREIVTSELQHLKPIDLHNAYIETTKCDTTLTGWCRSDHLIGSLHKHHVYLKTDTYRLLASMYKDRTRRDEEVDYMAILKAIEDLMASNDPRWRRSENQHSIMDANPRKADGLPILIKMVREYLHNNASDFHLDIALLHERFAREDIDKRGTLSIRQIEDILYNKHRVPLPESLLHDILRRYQKSNGQYSWGDICAFFERLEPPSQTGYAIPQSKRPLEYAKPYLEPNENWPRPMESQRNSPPHSYRNGYDTGRDYPQSERERRIMEKLRKTEEEIYELKYRNKELSPSPCDYEYEWNTGRRISNKIDDIEEDMLKLKFMNQVDPSQQNGFDKESKEKQILDEIKRTKNTIDDLKNSKQHTDRHGQQYSNGYGYGQMTEKANFMENWNKDMIQLGNMLYSMDEWHSSSSGFMPFTKITESSHMFLVDRKYQIPMYVINGIAEHHRNSLDKVEIPGFLDDLGKRGPAEDRNRNQFDYV